ncbi:MAG: VWA domain-containing protein, partial [Deltaproteobacteria bacterium]|nr:VWA domain-containing protein [Deltaproteobacteria bacterium]
TAKIREREKANKEFKAAKKAGKNAALLEQQRPNVFQMSVANIMPGDQIRVELDYTELLVPDKGVYEFAYPTVVGPRYSDKTLHQNPGDKWISSPYTRKGQAPSYRWDISASLRGGMPIEAVASPSHKLDVAWKGRQQAQIDVDDPAGGSRDFILRYRLAGKGLKSGVLLWQGGKEKFFLAMIQPPERVVDSMRPAREYIFILDVSGSMRGFPLETAKHTMRRLLRGMGPKDRFNIMTFAGGSRVFASSSVAATSANVREGLAFVDSRRGGGGTRIRAALDRALKMRRARDISTSFVVVTDGYVAVERETFQLIRDNLGRANLFAVGIGSSVNRHLIEGMARAGMGEPFVATSEGEARSSAGKLLAYIANPVLTNIKIDYDGFAAYSVIPNSVPDVLAERPIVIVGKYRGPARGNIRVRGFAGNGRFATRLPVTSARHGTGALRNLWARTKVRQLDDDRRVGASPKINQKILELGLEYGLLTEFTSFIAVDKRIRNQNGNSSTVKQPLPLPQGVEDSVISGARVRMASPDSGDEDSDEAGSTLSESASIHRRGCGGCSATGPQGMGLALLLLLALQIMLRRRRRC